MRVLVASLFLPEEKATHAGGRYVFEVIRSLSGRHEVSLATRFEEAESPHLEALRPFCKEIFSYPYRTGDRSLLANCRLILNYFRFSRYVNKRISSCQYDVALVQWVETALLVTRGRTPMILDSHDVISKPAERGWRQSSGAMRVPSFLKYLLVRTVERLIACRFDLVLVRSQIDLEKLLQLDLRLLARVVPHPAGLDIGERVYPAREKTILFLASYKHRLVNVQGALWFYREVFPMVREKVPSARFVIAGYGPPAELTDLAVHDPQVEVPGFVDDLDRCYKEAELFVAPILTGGGIIVKVLDALAAARPVVTTRYGNEGIGAVPGRDLLVADEPKEFAAAVVRLLSEPQTAHKLAQSGREFVRQHYGLESIISKIEAAFQDVTKSSRLP